MDPPKVASAARHVAALLDDGRAGRGSAIVLSGRPGSGRTWLLDQVVDDVTGWRVVRIHAAEADRGLQYGGIVVLLHRLGSVVPDLRRPCAELSARIATLVDPAPLVWFEQVLTLLGRAAADAPVLVAVDDAHHLDDSSATLVAQVARAASVPGLAIVLDAGGDRRFSGRVSTRSTSTPIGPDVAAEVLARRSGVTPSDAVVTALLDHVLGNVRDLVAVADRLDDEQLAGWRALPDPLPAVPDPDVTVLDDLPAETRRALLLTALARAPHPRVVARAIDLAGGTFADLEPAEARALVHLDHRRVVFPLSMVRSIVAAVATPAERRDAHLHLAAATEQEAPADRLAQVHHLAAASVVSDDRLVEVLLEAAGDRRGRGGPARGGGSDRGGRDPGPGW